MTNKPTPPNPPPAPKPRSFAQIHSVLDKLTIKHETAMARLDKESAERKTAHEKTMARLDKESAERKAEAAERKAEAAKRKAEREAEAAERKAEREAEREAENKRAARIDAQIEANNKQIGALNDGTVLEEDIFHALKESRTICNIPLDNVEHDVKSLRGDQFDIVGTNGKYVVVIEIKRTLNSDDAARFAKKKKPVFEQAFASMIGKKKVLGAMIYRRANKKARTAALENGLLLVHSVGKKKLHQIKN